MTKMNAVGWFDIYVNDLSRAVTFYEAVLGTTLEEMSEARDMRVAARVRRPGFAQRYPHQFTIRSAVASGRQTELSKIVNGKGDWMFYGHSNEAQTGLDAWWLIDLRAFRAGLIRHMANTPQIVMGDQANADGKRFKWFDVRSFPAEPPLVVASSVG